jgi:hypothetical protein
MAWIEVDDESASSITFAARLWDVDEGEVVRRLVRNLTTGTATPASRAPASGGAFPTAAAEASAADGRVSTWMDYSGHRIEALFDPTTRMMEIVSGPLRGQRFTSPSGACSAVKLHFRPEQTGSCNGWTTWRVSPGATLDRYR